MFFYCLGEEAEAVLSSTNATAEERNDYDQVLAKFDSFFQVQRTFFMNARGSTEGTSKAGKLRGSI